MSERAPRPLSPEAVMGLIKGKLELDNNIEEDEVLDALNAKIFNLVAGEKGFYNRANSKEADSRGECLNIAEELSILLDLQFLYHLTQEAKIPSPSSVLTIYPLRGAAGLKLPSDKSPVEEFLTQTHQPIGVERNPENQQEANLYPDKDFLQRALESIRETGVVRIIDFGIATGGTMEVLINKLIEAGIPEEHIIVQGVVGTNFAKERLSKQFPEVSVLYGVLGQMPSEIGEPCEHDCFYIKRLFDPTKREYQEVNPTDWGDAMFGGEWTDADLQAFLDRLRKIFELTDNDIAKLEKHYREKMHPTNQEP